MKKRLFLTGDQGCGKTSLIRSALGSRLFSAGGFQTLRTKDGIVLTAPDGTAPVQFLTLSGAEPVYRPELFLEAVRSRLLQPATFALLDEIGGVELLTPDFYPVLQTFFDTGIPCIGVVKNPASAEKLCRRLGLDESYLQAAADLRRRLEQDEDSLLVQADDQAAALVHQWVQKYVYE